MQRSILPCFARARRVTRPHDSETLSSEPRQSLSAAYGRLAKLSVLIDPDEDGRDRLGDLLDVIYRDEAPCPLEVERCRA